MGDDMERLHTAFADSYALRRVPGHGRTAIVTLAPALEPGRQVALEVISLALH